jgi:hypothetical protein
MTSAQLLAYIKHASSVAAVSGKSAGDLGDLLSAEGLVLMAERAVTGPGRQLRLTEEIASVLSKEKYIQATMRDLMHMSADEAALRNWVRYSVSLLDPVLKSKEEAETEVAAKGGSLWSGLEKSAQIGFRNDKTAEQVAAEVAKSHDAWDAFLTAAKLTSRFSAACAVANIGFGIYGMVDPNHPDGWMRQGDRWVGGFPSILGGAGQVMLWADGAGLSEAAMGITFAEPRVAPMPWLDDHDEPVREVALQVALRGLLARGLVTPGGADTIIVHREIAAAIAMRHSWLAVVLAERRDTPAEFWRRPSPPAGCTTSPSPSPQPPVSDWPASATRPGPPRMTARTTRAQSSSATSQRATCRQRSAAPGRSPLSAAPRSSSGRSHSYCP